MTNRLFSIVLLAIFCLPCFSEDPFALGVRNTPHLKPEEEQKLFKLPSGFEIQLIAAEPEIQKPLNMAFDGQGRLWVTDTIEYPYAAPLDKPGRDTIKVIEFDYTTGKATKITTFVDGLNIPIGLLPYKDGVIAYSIPNIWFFRDTNGDGKCDSREVLYGPFDHTRDTHGMCNAFRLGFDGWIYACHGFNNDSRVKGKDGHEVHMQSGNTFRFKPDGSRIEHFTHGQVNPFGMCFDDLFNIFTADCHSKPITQLLRGAYYPSFGKPHDGLGFVPSMMEHSHGSTAICGLVWVNGENFPPEYRGHLLSGNVMTSRINHNSLIAHGSTYQCKEEPDFLSAGDPWFRPVDLQIGPDGALYIADFYNRIIGHYEVPLPHPGRDRTSGRLWRVVYKGDSKDTKPAVKQKDLTKASDDELIAELNHPVLGQRLLAQEELINRERMKIDTRMNREVISTSKERILTHLIWIEARKQHNWYSLLSRCLGLPKPPHAQNLSMIHALKCMGEFPLSELVEEKRCDLLQAFLFSDEPPARTYGFVAQSAAECMAKVHDKDLAIDYIHYLLSSLQYAKKEDVIFSQTVKLAIRDYFTLIPENSQLLTIDDDKVDLLAEIVLAVPNVSSANYLTEVLKLSKASKAQLLLYITHAARYSEKDKIAKLIKVIQDRWKGDIEIQLSSLLAVHQGLAQRGLQSPELQTWAEDVCNQVLAENKNASLLWQNVPLHDVKDTENPWTLQVRTSADGNKDALFYSSLVKGEQKIGVYRSQAFELPRELSFWCAGHIGFPDKPALDLNYIRLRDATTHELLVEARPPRNDTAQKIDWNLDKQVGKRGYLELVDGDAGNAYAWLAVGRFSVSELNPNDRLQRLNSVTHLVKELQLKSLVPQLTKLLMTSETDAGLRGNIANTLNAFHPDARYAAVARMIQETALPTELSEQIADVIVQRSDDKLSPLLESALKNVPHRVHTNVAELLSSDVQGGVMLLQLVEHGKLSAYLLRHPAVLQKMNSHQRPEWAAKIKQLTERLPAANAELEKLLSARRSTFAAAKPDISAGAKVFEKNCAVCHQIDGKGAVIGPQLDGIGGRGLERVLEDVLDPHRNVDVAFRTTAFILHDGRIVTGLVRREEGKQLVLVGNDGKEFWLNLSEIEERNPLALSLMPSFIQVGETGALHETIPTNDMHNLLAYLLSQTAKKNP